MGTRSAFEVGVGGGWLGLLFAVGLWRVGPRADALRRSGGLSRVVGLSGGL